MSKGKIIKKITKGIKKSIKEKPSEDKILLVPSGSTMFNLECSGNINGAFQAGKMSNLIGDSSAGKSFLAFTIFAESAKNPKFDEYIFVYDDVEASNEFNIPKLFGQKCYERIVFVRSRTIEELNDNVARYLDAGIPFIYMLDSFDALTSEAFMEKDSDNRKKREKGNKIVGSYGDGKAKIFSDFCKNRIQDLKNTLSLLVVISQTRDNIGFGAQFTPKVRSGGRALKFFSCHEVWLDCTKTIKKGKRTIATTVRAKITKNKLTGDRGEATFQILRNYGIDDISSCINFLMDEGPWTGSTMSINTHGFVEEKMKIKKLVHYIESNNLQQKLKELCGQEHSKIMKSLEPERKPKY